MAITRVISDLHFTDSTSAVRQLSDIEPLFDGVDRMIVNGDALDTQVTPHAAELVAELKAFFAQHARQTDFIAGNHDPDISELDELLLADGAVWITHGHVLYDDVAPWSHHVPEIRRRLRTHGGHLSPAELRQLEHRYRVFRKVLTKLPADHDPRRRDQIARLLRMAKAVFPPQKFFTMLKIWRELPEIAVDFSREQRAQARVILTGHTHHPGIWRQPEGHVVINTGCFAPPRGAFTVDFIGEKALVRRVVRRAGEFRLGDKIAEIPLAPAAASALSARA